MLCFGKRLPSRGVGHKKCIESFLEGGVLDYGVEKWEVFHKIILEIQKVYVPIFKDILKIG